MGCWNPEIPRLARKQGALENLIASCPEVYKDFTTRCVQRGEGKVAMRRGFRHTLQQSALRQPQGTETRLFTCVFEFHVTACGSTLRITISSPTSLHWLGSSNPYHCLRLLAFTATLAHKPIYGGIAIFSSFSSLSSPDRFLHPELR